MKILIAAQDRSIEGLAKGFLSNHRFRGDVDAVILNVVEDPPDGYYATRKEQERMILSAQNSFNEMAKSLKQSLPAIDFKVVVIQGDAKSEILRYADDFSPDLILMSSHGRSVLARFFLGSVSLAVHAGASCSVFILRPPKELDPERSKESQAPVVATP